MIGTRFVAVNTMNLNFETVIHASLDTVWAADES